jgi:hypothetical protein
MTTITLHNKTTTMSLPMAIRHIGIPNARGKPFTVTIEHKGFSQTNRYSGCGELVELGRRVELVNLKPA